MIEINLLQGVRQLLHTTDDWKEWVRFSDLLCPEDNDIPDRFVTESDGDASWQEEEFWSDALWFAVRAAIGDLTEHP